MVLDSRFIHRSFRAQLRARRLIPDPCSNRCTRDRRRRREGSYRYAGCVEGRAISAVAFAGVAALLASIVAFVLFGYALSLDPSVQEFVRNSLARCAAAAVDGRAHVRVAVSEPALQQGLPATVHHEREALIYAAAMGRLMVRRLARN